MPLWGTTNVVSNACKWQVQAGSHSNGQAFFVNVTSGAAFTGQDGQAVGLFPVSQANTQAVRQGTGPGWVLTRQGVGPVKTLALANDGSAYANLAGGLIGNGTANAQFRVTVNATGHVQTIILDTLGAGFVNTGSLTITYPVNAVSSANISNSGFGYTNGDFVVFSNGLINSYATFTANSIGSITAIAFSNTGSGFDETASHVVSTITSTASLNTLTTLHITAGGTSYTNGNILTASNGTTNATFTVSTNSTGGITSFTPTAIGSGFDGVAGHVAINIANSTGGATGVGTAATIAANSFGPVYGSVVANSTSFSTGSGFVLTATLGGRSARVSQEILAVVKQIGGSVVPTATQSNLPWPEQLLANGAAG